MKQVREGPGGNLEEELSRHDAQVMSGMFKGHAEGRVSSELRRLEDITGPGECLGCWLQNQLHHL